MNSAVRVFIGVSIVVLLFLLIGLRMNQQLYGFKPVPLKSVIPTQTPVYQEDVFCGGIAGMPCPSGFICELDGNYPDAGGWCVRVNDTPVVKNSTCTDIGGTWSGEHRECIQIDEDQCATIGGTFNACASPCRHETNKDIVCIQMCVAVCSL